MTETATPPKVARHIIQLHSFSDHYVIYREYKPDLAGGFFASRQEAMDWLLRNKESDADAN